MKVNIKNNIKQITRGLNKQQKKQIPFATANAINQTLFQTRKVMMKQTEQKLDRPTPFTVKSYLVSKAKKSQLHGILFIKEAAEKYLKYQIEGGVRSPGKKFGIPTKLAKLNKFGNIPGRKKGLVKKKSQFLQTINGISGVWERTKDNKLKLIVALKNSANYVPKLPFYDIASNYAASKFNKNFVSQLNRALRSAK